MRINRAKHSLQNDCLLASRSMWYDTKSNLHHIFFFVFDAREFFKTNILQKHLICFCKIDHFFKKVTDTQQIISFLNFEQLEADGYADSVTPSCLKWLSATLANKS